MEEDTGIKLFHRHSSRNVTLTASLEISFYHLNGIPSSEDLDQTVLSNYKPLSKMTLQGKLKVMIMPVMLNKAQGGWCWTL